MVKMRNLGNKKGAMELSIGTIVIIVLAMSMLILGLVLIRQIFSGATGATDLINKNVESQINELFNQDDRRTVVYLPDNEAEVKKGKSYNIKFGIKNVIRGESDPSSFKYKVVANEVEQGCRGLTIDLATKYISVGATGASIKISPGSEPVQRIIVLQIPEDAPLCTVQYDLVVDRISPTGQVEQAYDTNFFIVKII